MFGDKVSREEIDMVCRRLHTLENRPAEIGSYLKDYRTDSILKVLEDYDRRLHRLERLIGDNNKVNIIKKPIKTDKPGVYNCRAPVEMTINQAIQLLADAIGMEFKTEAATPSKTVLVKKTEEDA
jgi:hypothetical protein